MNIWNNLSGTILFTLLDLVVATNQSLFPTSNISNWISLNVGLFFGVI